MFTVMKLDGSTFPVTPETRPSEFLDWYAAGAPVNDLTMDALDTVCLYLRNGGRQRGIEASLNLVVRPTEPGEEAAPSERMPEDAPEIVGKNEHGEYVGIRQRTLSHSARLRWQWHVSAFTVYGGEISSYLVLGDADDRDGALRLAHKHIV